MVTVRSMATAIVGLCLTSTPLSAQTERPSFNADSLKARMEGSAATTQRAGDRLKSTRGDLRSLQLLNSDNLNFKLPNGHYVAGVLLPNGKVAPAIVSGQMRSPACVTKEYSLMPGIYNAATETIKCQVAQAELAILEEGTTAQAGDGSKTQVVTTTTEKGGRSSSKYSSDRNADVGAVSDGSAPGKASGKKTNYTPPPVDPNVYRPPARNSSEKRTVAGVMTRDANLFGIPIGTWVKGQLLRRVSSAEGGTIEFQIGEDIEGKYQVMPSGTMLFSQKEINLASRRLESVSVTARLPDGREVPGVRMRVFSLDKTSGLNGQLIRDTEGELAHAGANALLNAAGNAAITAGNGVTGGIAEDFRGDLVSNEQRALKRAPKAVIEVNSQPVLLQVVSGF